MQSNPAKGFEGLAYFESTTDDGYRKERLGVLFDARGMRNALMRNNPDAVYDKIKGAFVLRENQKYTAWEVMGIFANPGYGPLLYTIAAHDEWGVIPDQTNNTSPRAKAVWRKFRNSPELMDAECEVLFDTINDYECRLIRRKSIPGLAEAKAKAAMVFRPSRKDLVSVFWDVVDEKLHNKVVPQSNPMSSVVWHSTPALKEILCQDRFMTSSAVGTSSDRAINKGKFYYFSTSRTPQNSYTRTGHYHALLKLDGDLLNQKYKGGPIDYWGPGWRTYEAEDRIYTDDPFIENATKYIKEIHLSLPLDSEWPKPKYYEQHVKELEVAELCAQEAGIPLYIYPHETDFKYQRKGRSLRSMKEWREQAGEIEELESTYTPRDYDGLAEIAEIVRKGIRPENKRDLWAQRIIYRSYRDRGGTSEFGRQLAAELHNAKSKASARHSLNTVVQAMKKWGASDPTELGEKLRERYETAQAQKNPAEDVYEGEDLYHVTWLKNLPSIQEYGLRANQGRNFSGFDWHTPGKVFVTEADGADYWWDKFWMKAEVGDAPDEWVEEEYIPVMLKFDYVGNLRLHDDSQGTRDARYEAYYTRNVIPADIIQVWNPEVQEFEYLKDTDLSRLSDCIADAIVREQYSEDDPTDWGWEVDRDYLDPIIDDEEDDA